MLPYLILYLIFVFWWIFDLTNDKYLKWIISVYILFTTVIFIGLRHEVGGDWGDYLMWYKMIEDGGSHSFEPGYSLINKISALLGGGIYLVNTISIMIIIIFFWKSAKIINISIPIFCLLIFPNHILIVLMGYSRQAIAISIAFYALVELLVNRRNWYFMSLVTVGVLFHYSAFCAFALLLFIRNALSIKIFILVTFIALISLYLNSDKLEPLLRYYINPDSNMVSYGAQLRMVIWTSILCMVIVFKSNLSDILRYGVYWKRMLFVYVICMIMLFFGLVTTLVDRLILYFYLIPYLGLSSIIYNTRKNTAVYGLAIWSCVLFSMVMTVGWLSYAIHKRGWLPYNNIMWSGDPPTADYSGETGYSIVKCTDEYLMSTDEYVMKCRFEM